LALPFFAVTLFVSAFLLFLVQPMIGKMILPRLGGTPQVWNTCMVFFQMALLAGYAYTHAVSSRLKLRQQLLLHCTLLLVPFLFLLVITGGIPFNVTGFTPPPGSNPIWYTLGFLALIVGVPFFVVATSAPLLQKWFASTGHPAGKDPYFLYAASNVGSLLALLAYPILVEPTLGLNAFDAEGATRFLSQPWVWTVGYGVLVLLVLGCAAYVWTSPENVDLARKGPVTDPAPLPETAAPPPEAPAPAPAPETGVKSGPAPGGGGGKGTAIKKGSKQKHKHHHQPLRREREPERAAPAVAADVGPRTEELTWPRRLRWIGLAAVPVSLMLGVTTYITTDLSPIPLFWLIPLTLYLLSFILVFMRYPIVWIGEPHKIFVYAGAPVLALLVLIMVGRPDSIVFPILVNVLAFFVTTMVCHGELAKDRPGTKHLTEFYLWMSVGGMLGGMFNALVAPILFVYALEFSLAIIAAALLRPVLQEGGWADTFVATMFAKQSPGGGGAHKPGPGGRHVRKGHPEETAGLHHTMDVVLPLGVLLLCGIGVLVLGQQIVRSQQEDERFGWAVLLVFGLPLVISCFFLMRPLRFGLAIAAVLLVYGLWTSSHDRNIYASRSYFGMLRVKKEQDRRVDSRDDKVVEMEYTTLIHGHINHGMNIQKPAKKDWGNPRRDFSRLPTTYYHRFGPAGVIMEKYNWFRDSEDGWGPFNTYHADARMPASIVALGVDPMSQLVNAWSEPPYATIGLGTGTMAAYSRWLQHMHYYEIDNQVRKLSEGDSPYFTFVKDAKDRGAPVWILMGDARLKMAQPYLTLDEAAEKLGVTAKEMYAQTPEGKRLRDEARELTGGPDNFYHMIVVDAFSSDAIPVHLITKEAIKMYFEKLRPDGILAVHTSNRYVDLVPVVADVANSLGFHSIRGHTEGARRGDRSIESLGHFSSEWVMVARDVEVLNRLKQRVPPDARGDYWTLPTVTGRHVWTDDYSNLMAVFKGK
jgi:hypothetical protein